MAALPGRPEEDGIAMLQAGTATAAYLATRLIMMAIACFQVLMTSEPVEIKRRCRPLVTKKSDRAGCNSTEESVSEIAASIASRLAKSRRGQDRVV